MTRLETTRRFAPWLVGLFLIAQIAGVVPLISAHTLHVFESKQVVSDGDGIVAVDAHGSHRHSIADLNDQCCAFHHLAGVLSYALMINPVRFAKVVTVSFVPNSLISADPALLERPPKSLSLI
jgi:hypothetical protein